MKKIRNWIIAMAFVATTGGTAFSLATPQILHADAPQQGACGAYLLTFPAWYRGLLNGECDVQSPAEVGLGKFIWTIVLNGVEVMLQLAGYIAVGFIITGGFKYMTSAGSPDGMTKAKSTILNAVIGLGISMISIGIVNVVAGAIK